MRRDDLTRRLRAAYRVEVAEDTAARQMAAIAGELGFADPAPASRGFRRRLAALAAVLAVVLPGGLAVAAEGTVPGDVLYPVKLVTETAWSLVDPAVPAEHRLQEVETMLERDVPLDAVVEHLRVADRTLSTLPDHDQLDRRFDHVVDLVRDRAHDRLPREGFPRHRADRRTDIGPVVPPSDVGSTDGSGKEMDTVRDAEEDTTGDRRDEDGRDMPHDAGDTDRPRDGG